MLPVLSSGLKNPDRRTIRVPIRVRILREKGLIAPRGQEGNELCLIEPRGNRQEQVVQATVNHVPGASNHRNPIVCDPEASLRHRARVKS